MSAAGRKCGRQSSSSVARNFSSPRRRKFLSFAMKRRPCVALQFFPSSSDADRRNQLSIRLRSVTCPPPVPIGFENKLASQTGLYRECKERSMHRQDRAEASRGCAATICIMHIRNLWFVRRNTRRKRGPFRPKRTLSIFDRCVFFWFCMHANLDISIRGRKETLLHKPRKCGGGSACVRFCNVSST